jgi:hypothetical protein
MAAPPLTFIAIVAIGGCVSTSLTSSPALRVLLAGSRCPSTQSPLNWYQAGGDGQKIVYQTMQVPADGSGGYGQGSLVSLGASCPSGYTVTGGGFV